MKNLDAEEQDLVDRYRHGWCAQFAVALHRRTGWTMVGIHGENEHGGPPRHVACLMPNGRYADVRGLGQSIEQICVGYAEPGEFAIRAVAASEMVARFTREPGAQERAQWDLDVVLPDLPFGAPLLDLRIEVADQGVAVFDGKSTRRSISNLDLDRIVDVLGQVPQIREARRTDWGIMLVHDLGLDETARRKVLIGWVESVLIGEALGLAAPQRGPLSPFPAMDAGENLPLP